jgi:GNAT superfamily N-acetyltransferase
MIRPDHAISAVSETGDLLGITGFKTDAGTFVGGEFSDLVRFYGWFGAAWRGYALSFLERPIEPGCLLMDGICVAPHARGQGVGTALLDAVAREAEARGLSDVRLDVIDSNPRAKALYERKGFIEGQTNELGPLKYIFGFKTATTMRLAV